MPFLLFDEEEIGILVGSGDTLNKCRSPAADPGGLELA
jgi:hypothetical protein